MRLLIQMHGDPGSGKSTLARAIATALPAVVIDKDVLKSTFLREGIPDARAGALAHECMRELAADLLAQGHTVILDSPCAWPEIERNGRELAARMGAAYRMIECVCPDAVELDRRLAARDGRESQPTARADWYARPGTARPTCERLIVKTDRPVGDVVLEALVYLRAERPSIRAGVAR